MEKLLHLFLMYIHLSLTTHLLHIWQILQWYLLYSEHIININYQLDFYNGFKIYSEEYKILYFDDNSIEASVDFESKVDLSEKVFNFVITDEESNRRYCTTLLFFVSLFYKLFTFKNSRYSSEQGSKYISAHELNWLCTYCNYSILGIINL